MKAEFHSESLQDLPRIMIHAESEIEWRALQLFMRLMEYGRTGVTASYAPENAIGGGNG